MPTPEKQNQNTATEAINNAMLEVDALLTKNENKAIVGDNAETIKGEAREAAEKAIKNKKLEENMNQLAKVAAAQSVIAWIAKEKDRQTTEDAANKLNELPDVWDIPLLTEKKESTGLPNTAWLDAEKNVILEYVPFVAEDKFVREPNGFPEQPFGKTVAIKWKGSGEEKEIVKIDIMKDGLRLTLTKSANELSVASLIMDMGNDLKLFNLANLKITLGENIKTIALWNPEGATIEKKGKGIIITNGDKSITLPEKQEFVIDDANENRYNSTIESTDGKKVTIKTRVTSQEILRSIKFTKISIKNDKGELVLVDNKKKEETE